MGAKEVIGAILDHENITAAQLAKDIGLQRPQSIYDILSGKTASISPRMARNIHEAKPIYNPDWLVTGNGNMLNEDIPASAIRTTKINEKTDALSVISHLVEVNCKLEREIELLRMAFQELSKHLETLISK